MKKNNSGGFTIDTFFSTDFGYRSFDVEPNFKSFFEELDQSKFATTFNVGLNFGNVFSFR
jgi:hypothetical protein